MQINNRAILTAESLSKVAPTIEVPRYQRNPESIGIVHLGPGAFHRAHQAVYVDELLSQGNDGWGICGVSLRHADTRDTLARQDYLYALTILDHETQFKIIGSIFDVLVARDQQADILNRLADERTRIVSMTITEKGYCLTPDGDLNVDHPDIMNDLLNPQQPVSAVGYLVEGLRRRRKLGLPAFTPLSCDNLTGNGNRLSKSLLQFANEVDQDLAKWIADTVSFPNTMVDSITPATDDKLRRRVSDVISVDDAWPIQREAFTQWIVEDRFVNGRPPWEAVGVTIASDVEPYEKAKLRLLNGAHSSLAYIGLLRGHNTVFKAMADRALKGFIRNLMCGEIAASLGDVPLDIDEYIVSILERFENPEMEHLLSQIAWDGSQKLPFRIMETVRDNIEAGLPVADLAVGVAAWMHFIRKRTEDYAVIVDPIEDALRQVASHCTGDAQSDLNHFASLSDIFSADLVRRSQFRIALSDAYEAIETGKLHELLVDV